MPEMPEVQGIVAFLGEHAVGQSITRADVTSVSALKTFDPPLAALVGAEITSSHRRGKFVCVGCGASLYLVFHLAKAGFLRWHVELPTTVIKLGRSPITLRVGLSDGSGFDLTEAGTRKSLAVYVVRDLQEVPGIARLGPDPLDDSFTRDDFAALLAGRGGQVKGLLRDQSVIAGIGNAYSDEILHAARISPYAIAGKLDDEKIDRLYAAMQMTLREAVAAMSPASPAELKSLKRAGMRVHARAGEACPVCGDTIRSVVFADRSMEYCPTCQTGGKVLADRRMSRLLR